MSRIPSDKIEIVKELYTNSNLSFSEISSKSGVSKSTVRKLGIDNNWSRPISYVPSFVPKTRRYKHVHYTHEDSTLFNTVLKFPKPEYV